MNVKNRKCRQQVEGSMDCGIWVCMFGEALVRDDPEFWEEVNVSGDIKNYNIRVLAGVLRLAEQNE